MSFLFEPLTDEQIDSLNIVEPGCYNFEVVNSLRKESKANNSMAELTLKMWDIDGKVRIVFDYLIFSKIPLNIKKVKNFCESVGLLEEYKKGCIREDLTGLCGKCTIDIQNEKPKEGGGFYPKRNIVSDYIKSNDTKSISLTDEFKDDEVPF